MANGIQILPTINPNAGIQGFAQNLVGGLMQQQQQKQQLADLQALGQKLGGIDLTGIQSPQVAEFAIQQMLQQGQAQEPILASPGEQLLDPRTGARIGEPIPEVSKPRAGALQVAADGGPSGLPAGTVFQADPVGNVKVISEPGGEGLSRADLTKLAVDESKAFRSDERIKNLQIVERSERGMQAALRQSTSPNAKSRIASDQALGVLFQKMLDPTSVVRESEFARTPQGAAMVNRVLGSAEKIVKGGLALQNEDRQALVTMAQRLLDESKITANKAFSEFSTRADQIGLNKKIVFGNAKPFNLAPTQVEGEIGTTLKRPPVRGIPSPPASVAQQRQDAIQRQATVEIPSLEEIEAEMKRRGLN